MVSPLDDAALPDPVDSGYTLAELDRLLVRAIGAARLRRLISIDALGVALALGVSDGDVILTTNAGTVMLRTPRATIDGRCASVRARLTAGATLAAALEAACDEFPDP